MRTICTCPRRRDARERSMSVNVTALPPIGRGNGCVGTQQDGGDSEPDSNQETLKEEPTVTTDASSSLAPPLPPPVLVEWMETLKRAMRSTMRRLSP